MEQWIGAFQNFRGRRSLYLFVANVALYDFDWELDVMQGKRQQVPFKFSNVAGSQSNSSY
jgi:hypothetical protein